MTTRLETRLRGSQTEVVISADRPTVIIGERINPSGKRRLADSLRRMDMSLVREEAIAQVRAGADVIDVNVGAAGVDEVQVLPLAVRTVAEAVPVPISIDTANADALAAALDVCPGKPLVNSVKWEKESKLLPLIVQRGAAVIGLAMGEEGIPKSAAERFAMAAQVLRACITAGVPREDVILDPLVFTVATDTASAVVLLEVTARLARVEGVNITLGASNVSFGLPDRPAINDAMITLAIAAGVTCPILDPTTSRRAVVVADLLLGKDADARRYMRYVRQQKEQVNKSNEE